MAYKEKVLVVDDEPKIRGFLKHTLNMHDYDVIEAESGARGIEYASSYTPSIILQDISLPDGSGLDAIRKLREWSDVPIIMLTASDREEDILKALESGADDYVTKPFSLPQLVARIKACTRRYKKEKFEDEVFKTGDVEMNFDSRIVTKGGKEVDLTNKEYELLKVLIENSEKIVTHRQLLKPVWGPSAVNRNQYLRVYIGHLRKKLEDNPDDPKIILTEPGIGYRLKVLETPATPESA